jgi:virulence-associated protein VapD
MLRVDDLDLEALVAEGSRQAYHRPMYAIAFDLDTNALKDAYPGPSYNNGYAEIKAILEEFGFSRQQGSVYYGDDGVDSVSTVLAAQELSKRLPWFKASVKDIRVLQLLANDDLARVL